MKRRTAMLRQRFGPEYDRTVQARRCAGGNEVSTEELRQSLRRYRSFFERLLAA